MHTRPEDLIAQREQREAAHGVMTAERRRHENAAIGALLAAFTAADGEPDPRAAGILRERFKTELIAVEGELLAMTPGVERDWVAGFVRIGRIFADGGNPVAERGAAAFYCSLIATRLRDLRGLA